MLKFAQVNDDSFKDNGVKYWLGNVLWELNEIDEAEKMLRQHMGISTSKEKHTRSKLNFAHFLYFKGDHNEAEHLMLEFLGIDKLFN